MTLNQQPYLPNKHIKQKGRGLYFCNWLEVTASNQRKIGEKTNKQTKNSTWPIRRIDAPIKQQRKVTRVRVREIGGRKATTWEHTHSFLYWPLIPQCFLLVQTKPFNYIALRSYDPLLKSSNVYVLNFSLSI